MPKPHKREKKKQLGTNIILIIDRKAFGKILDNRIQVDGSGRYPRERNGNSLQYSCPENPMDRRAWQATGSQRVGHVSERLHFHFIYMCVSIYICVCVCVCVCVCNVMYMIL